MGSKTKKIALCDCGDVAEGEVLQVLVGQDHALAVYRWEGNYFCTDDLCTHGEASLSDGEIEDGDIICPFHFGAFCIKTGQATQAPCSEPVTAYSLEIVGGTLYINASDLP